MPKRTDINSILILGAGPIIISQACEFDYSGVQACKALRAEGYRVILINSNPATIMTDPEFADTTYIEPLTVEIIEKVIERERPDALLPTVGGQTALNLAVALASKATGFPIAKIAALLAVGYSLDEIPNDITRETPASFEPSLDYVVVKLPRWAFEKFPGIDPTLGPQMKSVGEVMAIGRTFKEALGKGMRGLEIGDWRGDISRWQQEIEAGGQAGLAAGLEKLQRPSRERLFQSLACLHAWASLEAVAGATGYDPWFVDQLAQIVEVEQAVAGHSLANLPLDLFRQAKRYGLSDQTIAHLLTPTMSEAELRQKRLALGLTPVYQRVDTCAAEFEAYTPYLYSAYESQCEANPSGRKKVMILGGGPNRIGQGIEFDYCCVHACYALRQAGLLIVQFGGQTPLNLAEGLAAAGAPIWGTSPAAIAMAEDREQFEALLNSLDIDRPPNGIATNLAEARLVAQEIGYPVLVRPSYVLGGRAMAVVYNEAALANYVAEAIAAAPGRPILIDHYLEDTYEVDVDAVADCGRPGGGQGPIGQ
jgi:carbamoyl-phosphate synthase large subunit